MNVVDIYEYLLPWAISLMNRVFAYGLGDRGSISGRVIPKTQKMVLDAALPSTQHYKVRVKGKVKQSWEWSGAFLYTSRSPSIKVPNFTYFYLLPK